MRYRAALVSLLSLALVSAAALPARAQKTTIPSGVTAVKRDQAWWTSQLRLARETGRKALVGLQHAPTDDESVLQACRDTYVLVRAARYGVMEAVRDDKTHDPLLQLTMKRVEQAWTLSRTAVDKAGSAGRQEYLEAAVRDLGQSMRLLDQVLIILP